MGTRPCGTSSLGAAGYADLIAHILAANGFPDGQQELPANGSILDTIIVDKKKWSATSGIFH